MKKFYEVVSYSLAALFSVSIFAWFAFSGLVVSVKSSYLSSQTSKSVYELLSAELDAGAKTSIIFAIIAMVLAILLTITCIAAILSKLGKRNIKWFGWIGIFLSILFIAAAFTSMICMISYGAENSISIAGASTTISCGIGLIVTAISSIFTLIFLIIANLKIKKK